MWLTLIAVASAHPFESRLYGHQTTLWLTDEAVTVEYAVEIPTAELLAELRETLPPQPTPADQAAFNERLHRDLRDALRLVVDGEAMSWAVSEPTEDSGRGDVKFIVYRLQTKAPLPAEARTLQLIDGNYPDEPSIFQVSVLVGEGMILDASSQLTVEDGVLLNSRDGLWRAEEDNRELRLSFRRRTPTQKRLHSLLRLLGGIDAEIRPSSEVLSTLRADPAAELSSGRLSSASVLMTLALSAVLGLLSGIRWWVAAGCALLVGGGLLVAGLPWLASGCAGVLLGLAGAVHRIRRHQPEPLDRGTDVQ